MRIEGERAKRLRLVRTARYIVEVVLPPDDPSEPCYEAETVQWLRQVQERAERGDEEWLLRQGRVYELKEAA